MTIRVVKRVLFMAVLAATALFGQGCVEDSHHVESVDVPRTPIGGGATLKGMAKEDMDYFKDIYPPDYWVQPQSGTRVAVGPVLVSKEAMLYLGSDDRAAITAKAEAGTGKDITYTSSADGNAAYFLTEKTSFESQGIVVETISSDGSYDVYTLDKKASYDLYTGGKSYNSLIDEGIKYYISGNMTVDPGNEEVRLYLRFVDALTKKVVCAVSAKGVALDSVSRDATNTMLGRLKEKNKDKAR